MSLIAQHGINSLSWGGEPGFEEVFLTWFRNTSGLTDTPEIGSPYTLSGGTIKDPGNSGIYVDGAYRAAWNASSGWQGVSLNSYVQNKKKAILSCYIRIPAFGAYAPMKGGLDYTIYFRYPGGYDHELKIERYNNSNPVQLYLHGRQSGDIFSINDFPGTTEPFFKTSYEIDFENKTLKFFYKGLLVAETKYTQSGLVFSLNPVNGGNISMTGISLLTK